MIAALRKELLLQWRTRAQFIAVHQWNFFDKMPVLEAAAQGATLLINAPLPANP